MPLLKARRKSNTTRRTDRPVSLRLVSKNDAAKIKAVEINETLIPSSAEPLLPASQSLSKEKASSLKKVHSALTGLSVLQFEVITALFPENRYPETHETIAARFGLAVNEVKNIEAEALRSLRGTRRGLKGIGAPWN